MLVAMAAAGVAVEEVTAQDAAPTVAGVSFASQPHSGDTYAVGELIEIRVDFTEAVTVTGRPQLKLTIGTTARTASLRLRTSTRLWFQYEVQAEDLDRDGISVGADALSLNGGSIKDSTNNDADLDLGEHAIGNDGSHKVDGSIDYAPTVQNLYFMDSPQSGDTYAVGELVQVEIEFSETITVTGAPELTLDIGSATRAAQFASAWRQSARFRYEVQAEDLDTDGISIAADALRLNGGTIRDSGGNDAELNLGEHARVNLPQP